MDCREFRKDTVPFLENKLDDRKMRKFLNHIEECDYCNEELKTQFLVKEGLAHLEKGEAFDFQTEFSNKMQNIKARCRNLEITHLVLLILEWLGFAFVITMLLIGIIF